MSHILPAPAKINLHLHVRAILDNGMHELDTSFVFTDACDRLTFNAAHDIQVTCSLPHLGGENNLVYRVLHAFQKHCSINNGLAVHIEKKLPEQSGLGGGSSDAATALIYANELWQRRLNRQQLIDFSTPFGADIPCFLYGRASLASGIGERLIDYPEALPNSTLLMAWPGSGLSTAEVFRHFDGHFAMQLKDQDHRALTPSEGVDTMRRDLTSMGQNDLEASACSLNKQVSTLLQFLRRHSDYAWMSGSGSTCVALMDSKQAADALALQVKAAGLASWTHTGKLLRMHPVQLGLE
jgi:4-diphosphocytidyl-2-C-methyl-D-erythritol kinase